MSSSNNELIKALREEAETLTVKRQELEERSSLINNELAQVRKRQDLVDALLEASGFPVSETAEAIGQVPALSTDASNSNRRNVGDIAYSILLSRGKKPMYYEDLAVEVQKAGGALGGVTPAQTLVARISKDPRFVRPEKRGWYAARDFYPKAKNVGARRPHKPSAKTSRRGSHD